MTNESLEILKMVHQFYNDAWSELITYTIALLAFVGAAVPLFLQFIQNRAFKAEHENIKKELKKEIDKMMDDSILKQKEGIRNMIDDGVKTVKREAYAANGGVFYVQGIDLFKHNLFGKAVNSFLTSASYCIKSGDERNLCRTLDRIWDCLPKMTPKDFEGEEVNENYEELLKDIKEINKGGRYDDIMEKIKKKVKELKGVN